jgi:site-specific DNA recombinase
VIALTAAAIYTRVSTEDQADGYSLLSQLEACQKLAAQHGYTVPEHYIFQEDFTGKILDRPRLPHLREVVRTRAVQAVIIYDADRLARRFALQVILEEEMDQAGVKLLYVNHTRDDSPEGRAMGYMRGVFAEIEREKIMERTQRGRLYRARAGQVWGGEVKPGYRTVREPHRASWEIDEEEAALVQRIFQMALEGMSEWAIAGQLTREHIPTCRDRRGSGPKRRGVGVWTPSTVHRILRYEGYTGRWYFGKYRRVSHTQRVRCDRADWIEVPIPAIIDAATFQAVQRQLATNKTTSRRNRKYDYLLTGRHLRCGRCGRAMSGRTSRGKFRYYRCAS